MRNKSLFLMSMVVLLSFSLLLGSTTETKANSETKIIFLDGGIDMKGRTMLPMRSLFESIGATVNWDSKTKTVKASKEGTLIELKIDSNKAIVNGKTVNLDVAPKIINSTTMVPVRFVSESLNSTVNWDGNLRLVTISFSGVKVFVHVNDPAKNTDKDPNINKHNQLVDLYNYLKNERNRTTDLYKLLEVNKLLLEVGKKMVIYLESV